VGHSMGSFVARRAAALAPSRITGLVLMGAAVSPDNSVVRDLERQVNALTDPIDPAFVRAFQDSTVALPVPEAFMSAAVAESRRLDARAWKAVFAGILGYVPAEQTIRVPTLVLGGDKDSVFSEREHRSLAGAIAGARVVMVPGVGHTLHWEQPERFVSELIGFASGSIPVARGR